MLNDTCVPVVSIKCIYKTTIDLFASTLFNSFPQYDTDFYVLDKYPLAVRPFYTMPDPNNPVSLSLTHTHILYTQLLAT